jgi:predicted nucleic acid-binding protein
MPETGRIVVVNSTPIISLSTVQQLDLLRHLYGEVVIPAAVRSEVLAGGPRKVGANELAERPWMKAFSLRDPGRANLLSDLDRGEAEVIALAQELQAGLVIIDERLARRHAERLGLSLTGTMGVLLKAKEAGLIDRLEPLIRKIRAAGIRLGNELVRRVLELAGE